MGLTIEDLVHGVESSRAYFLKHLNGVTPEQWDWKPYAECKSIRETLAHLVSDDRAAKGMLETGEFTDYDAVQEAETDIERLKALLARSHMELCALIRSKFADTALDTEANFFMGSTKLGLAISECSSEDYYHAGQVAFMRLATDPSWNYYAQIYGGG